MSTYKGSHLSIFDELDVHPEEGKIYHKHDKFWGKYYKSIKAKKGQEAGCLSNQSGRWKICVTNNKKSKSYLRSSLIDLYKHGNWCPKDLEIDHINRDQSDDRICNLRRVSRQKNVQNTITWTQCGYKFVYHYKNGWYVRFTCPNTGKVRWCGTYTTLVDAVKVRNFEIPKSLWEGLDTPTSL